MRRTALRDVRTRYGSVMFSAFNVAGESAGRRRADDGFDAGWMGKLGGGRRPGSAGRVGICSRSSGMHGTARTAAERSSQRQLAVGQLVRSELFQLREDQRALSAITAKDVLAAPQEPHQRSTRDPAYAGGTAFRTGGHGNHESIKKRTIRTNIAGTTRMHSALAHVTRRPTGGFMEGGNSCLFINY